jgi:hypothetical protein
MANHVAFECGECCSFVVLVDGWKETKFTEDEEFEFSEFVSELGIPIVSVNMCSDCDLRYN